MNLTVSRWIDKKHQFR